MSDIYSLLMAEDEPSAAEKAQAMVAALRKQRAAGNLGLLTGDKVLSGFGQAQLQQAGQQEGLLGQAGTHRSGARLRQALEETQARKAEANAQRSREWALQDDQRNFSQQLYRDSIQNRESEGRARIMAGLAQQKADQTAERGTVVPGLEKVPTAAPTAKDAENVKKSQASAKRLRQYVTELRALHDEHGTELMGPAATRMQQLQTAIELEGKNIAELGALSGPDLALMQSIAGQSPASIGANLKSLVGIDNTPTALKGLEQWVSDQEAANLDSYGYRKPAGAGRRTPTNSIDLEQPPAPAEKVINGKTYRKNARGRWEET